MDKPLKQQVREKYPTLTVTPNTVEDKQGYEKREALGWGRFAVGDRIKRSMDRRLEGAVGRVADYLAPALGPPLKPIIVIGRHIETSAMPSANKLNIDRSYALSSQKKLEGALGEEYTHLVHGTTNPETDPSFETDEGKRVEKSSVSETAGGLGRKIVSGHYGLAENLLTPSAMEDEGHRTGYLAAENMYGSRPDSQSQLNELGDFVRMPLDKAAAYTKRNAKAAEGS